MKEKIREFDNRIGAELGPKADLLNKDNSAKLKKIAFFLLIAALLIGFQLATQRVAWIFYYDQALGKPLFGSIYPFWNYFVWQAEFGKAYPAVFDEAFSIVYLSAVPVAIIMIILIYKSSLKLKANKFLHGSARWANINDIQDAALLPKSKKKNAPVTIDNLEWWYKVGRVYDKVQNVYENHHKKPDKSDKVAYQKWNAGLKAQKTKAKAAFERKLKCPDPTKERPGVIVGAWVDPVSKNYYYLRDYSKTHVLMIAKTRSGKGVGPINSTVGSWKDSMFVYDIKGELWALFSGRRKEMGQYTIKFEPACVREDINEHSHSKDGTELGRRRKYGEYNDHGLLLNGDFSHGKLTGMIIDDMSAKADRKGNHPKKTIPLSQCPELEPQYNASRWNPLEEIRYEGSDEYYYDKDAGKIMIRRCSGQLEIPDAQNTMELVFNPDGNAKNDHWEVSGKELAVGMVIHMLHNLPELASLSTLNICLAGGIDFEGLRKLRKELGRDPKTHPFESIEEIRHLLSKQAGDEGANGVDMQNVYADMIKGVDWEGKEYAANGVVITAGSKQKNRPKDEGGSVLSTAQRFLTLYNDPVVSRMTAKSDFKIVQLMNMDKPTSVFLVVQPPDKDRLRPLVRLFINRVLRILAADMKFVGGRSVDSFAHRLLLMIDEMPSLGKLDILQESLSYVAGYGMKAFLVTQDITQLKDIYGDKESIRANCQIMAWYATSNEDTAKEMSAKIGTTTVVKESVSISGSGFKANKSRSIQETARPLLTVDECMQLPAALTAPNGDIIKAGAMIITPTGFPAIYGEQPLYFKNPELLRRASLPTIPYSDVLIDAPGSAKKMLEEAKNKNGVRK
ncbi:MAG: type IV secretory system conjugative DNA transfer family protein [Succinatimonas hippei]|nr:type IV secretory system conjugative DNA transfer family protein [Succinatimonas hippei]